MKDPFRRELIILWVVAVITTAILASAWEFFIEPALSYSFHLGSVESFEEQMEYLVTSTLFVAVALLIPLQIALVQNRKRMKAQEENKSLVEALELSQAGIMITDAEGIIEYVSPALCRMTGYSSMELKGRKPSIFKSGKTPEDTYRDLWHTITNGREWWGEFTNKTRQGEDYFEYCQITPVTNGDGQVKKYIAVKEDVTDRKRTEKELTELSNTDPLTGLANRRAFTEKLKTEWRRCMRQGHELGIIILDIDHFKEYNDNYGHQAGDDCLRKVGEVINSCVKRAGDMAARIGGEEFVLILPDTPMEKARQIAEDVRNNLETMTIPHTASSTCQYVTISAGVASGLPKMGENPETLVNKADTALYSAKNDGRNRVGIPTPF